jgi:ribokinase
MEEYILVIGSLNCDMIFLQDRLPEKAETYLGKSASVCSGGKGANQAVQAAKLGAPTKMVGKVGKDALGRFLRGTIANYGVDISALEETSVATGMAAVHTLPDGVYYSTVAPGANLDMTIKDVKGWQSLIANAKVVVLQLEIPIPVVEAVIAAAHQAGTYVVLNAAPAAELSEETLRQVDCLIANEVEASYYLGTTIYSQEDVKNHYQEVLAKVGDAMVITLGDRGSVLCDGTGVYEFTPVPGVNAVETTGSGDSYVGAFAYQKFKGATNREACDFAASVAEYTVTKVGAQDSMPTLEEIKEYRVATGRES